MSFKTNHLKFNGFPVCIAKIYSNNFFFFFSLVVYEIKGNGTSDFHYELQYEFHAVNTSHKVRSSARIITQNYNLELTNTVEPFYSMSLIQRKFHYGTHRSNLIIASTNWFTQSISAIFFREKMLCLNSLQPFQIYF